MSSKKEIQEQAKAFEMMDGNILANIAKYAEEFRDIINEFEAMHGKEPTANDILWIASERHCCDLTKEN